MVHCGNNNVENIFPVLTNKGNQTDYGMHSAAASAAALANTTSCMQGSGTIGSISNISGRRILLTGAAGFIGFHLADLLHRMYPYDQVIGLDNFNDYYDVELKHMRSNLLRRNHNMTVIRGDACDEALIQSLFERYNFTHVVHMAAQAGVRHSLDHPKAYVTANIMCNVNLLEAIRKHNTRIPFIYASSSSVYGLNTKIPFSETDTVSSPSNVYGATKLTGENLATVYNHLYGISVIGLRFFTVYGPYGRPDMAIFKWADSISRNKPIPLFFKDKMDIKRDFTYVDDIVKGIEASMRLNTFELDHNAPQIFNLGNNHPENVDALVSYLAKEMNVSSIQKTMIPLPETDMIITYADIEKAMCLLDFKPSTSLEKGTKEFIQWYKETYWPEDIVFTTYFTGKEHPERQYLVDNDSFEQMRIWYESVHALGLHAIIFHDSLNEDFVNKYVTPNVRFVKVKLGPRSNNDERFFIYERFLNERIKLNPAWAPKRVLMTDLFDVKFNKNPFDFMRLHEQENNLQNNSNTEFLFIGSEEELIRNNQWLQTRLSECASKEWQFLMDTKLLNPGIVGGKVSTLLRFLPVYNEAMRNAPVKANCNTPMFNIVIRQAPDWNDSIVTGTPFHTEFKKEDWSPAFYIKHK
jgi:UDP-glucuronate 4-epimerase